MFLYVFYFLNVFCVFIIALLFALLFVLKTSTQKITNMMQFISENCVEHFLVVT